MKYAQLFSCALLGMGLFAPSAFSASLMAPELQTREGSFALVTVQAHAGKEAEQFISKLAEQGIGFLGNGTLSEDQRKSEFNKLLRAHFDMETIARFSLGRYWKTANDAQRQEYLNSFKKMIVKVYSERFKDYKGQQLKVSGSRPEGTSDILVNSSIIQPSGPEVAVDWRVRNKNGQYKVVDVLVEGVSMAVTQRADFASVIQRGGGDIKVLLDHLKTY